jgi:hypothetical protein
MVSMERGMKQPSVVLRVKTRLRAGRPRSECSAIHEECTKCYGCAGQLIPARQNRCYEDCHRDCYVQFNGCLERP